MWRYDLGYLTANSWLGWNYLIINSTVPLPYHMIRCEYCTKGFVESQNGLVEKTFHEMLHGPEVINK